MKYLYSAACTNLANVSCSLCSQHLPTFVSKLIVTRFPRIELNQLSGVAAILTFPLDIEVVEEEERVAKEEEENARLDALHDEQVGVEEDGGGAT